MAATSSQAVRKSQAKENDDFNTRWLTYHSFPAVRVIKACLFMGETPFKEFHVGRARWDSYNANGCILEYKGASVTHSFPVLLYVAKLAKLYPVGDPEWAVQIDEFMDNIRILRYRLTGYLVKKDKNNEAGLKEMLEYIVERMKALGGLWLTGDKMTVADLELQNCLRLIPKSVLGISIFRKHGKDFAPLNKICVKVAALDIVKRVDDIERKLLSGSGEIEGGLRETVKLDDDELADEMAEPERPQEVDGKEEQRAAEAAPASATKAECLELPLNPKMKTSQTMPMDGQASPKETAITRSNTEASPKASGEAANEDSPKSHRSKKHKKEKKEDKHESDEPASPKSHKSHKEKKESSHHEDKHGKEEKKEKKEKKESSAAEDKHGKEEKKEKKESSHQEDKHGKEEKKEKKERSPKSEKKESAGGDKDRGVEKKEKKERTPKGTGETKQLVLG